MGRYSGKYFVFPSVLSAISFSPFISTLISFYRGAFGFPSLLDPTNKDKGIEWPQWIPLYTRTALSDK